MNRIRHLQATARPDCASAAGRGGRSLKMISKIIWNALGFVLFVVGSIWLVGAWIESLKAAVL